jgi:hypothetical protein
MSGRLRCPALAPGCRRHEGRTRYVGRSPDGLTDASGQGDAVLNGRHARRRPCGAFSGLPVGPHFHMALQRHSSVVNVDPDRLGLQFGIALEDILDALLDVGRLRPWLSRDRGAVGLRSSAVEAILQNSLKNRRSCAVCDVPAIDARQGGRNWL